MHPLLIALTTSPAPAPSPALRPGLSEDQVTPGLLGFLLTAFIVVLTALLIVDMVRRIRRVRYRAQVEQEGTAKSATQDDGAAQPAAAQSAEGQDRQRRDSAGAAGAAGPRPEANGDAGPGPR